MRPGPGAIVQYKLTQVDAAEVDKLTRGKVKVSAGALMPAKLLEDHGGHLVLDLLIPRNPEITCRVISDSTAGDEPGRWSWAKPKVA